MHGKTRSILYLLVATLCAINLQEANLQMMRPIGLWKLGCPHMKPNGQWRGGCSVSCIIKNEWSIYCATEPVCRCNEGFCSNWVVQGDGKPDKFDGCLQKNPVKCHEDESGITVCVEKSWWDFLPAEWKSEHHGPTSDHRYEEDCEYEWPSSANRSLN